ncbi:MAG TPA: NYN domain-containing protein [Nocardioidaceae bacterium]|nr:NYN domain-containing protein [Nocardioidaceae bacterium]
MTSPQTADPRQRADHRSGRSLTGPWPQWICYCAAFWSLLYGVLGSFWALGGAGFPFGGAHDDTSLALAQAAFAGPVMAAIGFAGGVLAVVMARGGGRGPLRPLLIGYGVTTAVALALVVPGHRPLMAVARTPLVLVGAPFGWPPDLGLGEFFSSMYPWPVVNQLLFILGGLLWGGATLAYTRRTGDACAGCGRPRYTAAWATADSARRWGRWAVAIAVAIPMFYALTRWAWALGVPLGFSRQELRTEQAESPGIWLAGAGLATLAAGGALLTLGLVQRWGEAYPRWVPFRRGRRVHPRTAIIPAAIVAVLVTAAGMAYLRALLFGQISLDWGSGPTLLWPLWGAGLAAATLAYHLRRRGECRDCANTYDSMAAPQTRGGEYG